MTEQLITIGCLVMTPDQLKRALTFDMTVSQALKMIEDEKATGVSPSPLVSDVEDDLTVTTGKTENPER